ncbi:MAG: DUF4147 domain-containing protein [Chloroflexi bacterium]|nr:DUF4147 domain-containing protein [Chloroflexota bacterium]
MAWAKRNLLRGLSADDLVICLVSGGGSALMEWLVEGVSLDALRALTTELLRCGATINEINALRKHISRVKGGQLARLAQPARVVALILSDVLGSPLDVIASGLTAPDSTTFADCLRILDRYGLREKIPASIRAHLERGARGESPETPKADDPLFARVTNVIIADNQIACDAAAQEAKARGYTVELVGTDLQGGERVERAERVERGERAERAKRAKRAERVERAERAKRAERVERAERAKRASRAVGWRAVNRRLFCVETGKVDARKN